MIIMYRRYAMFFCNIQIMAAIMDQISIFCRLGNILFSTGWLKKITMSITDCSVWRENVYHAREGDE